MKKTHVLLCLYLIVGILLFTLISFVSPTDINGRARSLDFARLTVPHYDSGQIIHTETTNEYVVDFVLDKESNLYIVATKYTRGLFQTKYRVEEVRGFYTTVKAEECVEFYNETASVQWNTASKYSNKPYNSILWCVMDDKDITIDNNVTKSTFSIDGKAYAIYVSSYN